MCEAFRGKIPVSFGYTDACEHTTLDSLTPFASASYPSATGGFGCGLISTRNQMSVDIEYLQEILEKPRLVRRPKPVYP